MITIEVITFNYTHHIRNLYRIYPIPPQLTTFYLKTNAIEGKNAH